MKLLHFGSQRNPNQIQARENLNAFRTGSEQKMQTGFPNSNVDCH